MNYEVDQYVESLKGLPSREISLHTMDDEYFYFKSDIMAKMITYSTDKHSLVREETITAARALEIIGMNREGKKPMSLREDSVPVDNRPYDLLDQDNINRFDAAKKKKKKKKKKPQQPQDAQQ
jgi:hypothetical protein